MYFLDRRHAGRMLAGRLAGYANRQDVIVLGLPRGGVPVGFEVARALKAPLEVFIVRKLRAPGNHELAIGAVASGGMRVLNREVIASLHLDAEMIGSITQQEVRALEEEQRIYMGDRAPRSIAGKTVILVDDGIATGATMRAAAAAIRQPRPARLVIGVPTCSIEACEAFRAIADDMVCGMTPEPFYAVGLWYDDFSPVSDAEVQQLLHCARSSA